MSTDNKDSGAPVRSGEVVSDRQKVLQSLKDLSPIPGIETVKEQLMYDQTHMTDEQFFKEIVSLLRKLKREMEEVHKEALEQACRVEANASGVDEETHRAQMEVLEEAILFLEENLRTMEKISVKMDAAKKEIRVKNEEIRVKEEAIRVAKEAMREKK